MQAPANGCCLIVLDLLKSTAQMNQSDAFHNSASPQESSGSLLPHLAHSSAPKSPGSLAIQLHAIDSSIQTGPTDIPQGELHFSAHCSHLSYTWTCLFCTSSFKYFWLTQMTWCWRSSHKTHASDAGFLAMNTCLRCLFWASAFWHFGCIVQ